MPDDCYAKIGGGSFGPLSISSLKKLAQLGKVKADTPIRRGKDGKWIAAGMVKGLQDCFELDIDLVEPQSLSELHVGADESLADRKEKPFAGWMIAASEMLFRIVRSVFFVLLWLEL